jgi:hypothetical protein
MGASQKPSRASQGAAFGSPRLFRDYRWLTVNRSPPKRPAKTSAFQCLYGFDCTTEELAMPVYITVHPQNPEGGLFATERRNLNILGKGDPAMGRRGIIDLRLVILCDANHEIVSEDFNLLHVFGWEDAFQRFLSFLHRVPRARACRPGLLCRWPRQYLHRNPQAVETNGAIYSTA